MYTMKLSPIITVMENTNVLEFVYLNIIKCVIRTFECCIFFKNKKYEITYYLNFFYKNNVIRTYFFSNKWILNHVYLQCKFIPIYICLECIFQYQIIDSFGRGQCIYVNGIEIGQESFNCVLKCNNFSYYY